MSLCDLVTVRSAYTRSINVEKHRFSLDSVNGYLPTSRAINTLERVVSTFREGEVPRSWSLVGPYGSGKSAFAVFLSALLADPNSELFGSAYANLLEMNSELANKFKTETQSTHGYIRVLISGSSESLCRRIVQSLHASIEEVWLNSSEKPEVLKNIRKVATKNEISATELVNLIKLVQEEIQKSNKVHSKGIVLVIDELGKFLEYSARHKENNDLFVLQAIAEHAQQPHTVRLLQFVMLHKSFEHYAQNLTEHAKNQWAAVQGRFEEIPFVENSEQVLKVVSKAIEHAPEIVKNTSIKNELATISETLNTESALPSGLSLDDAKKLFLSCYPLHPVSALLLPMLCQRIAQNERTLFSYLGSSEEFGFKFLLNQLNKDNKYINPSDVYDYFINNQSSALGDLQTSRRWAEVVTAVERLGDVRSKETIDLLKTIGILNIVGAKGGFKPSLALLSTCFEKSVLSDSIEELNQKSIITFRSFNKEYRVWQGSDFDLQEALEEELGKVHGISFSTAKELTASNPMAPIVARKHTIQTGSLRYFLPTFSDRYTIKEQLASKNESRIIFYLEAEGEDSTEVIDKTTVALGSDSILCLVPGSSLLNNVTREINALRCIATRQEVHSDPVAMKELQVNLSMQEVRQKSLLNELVILPEKSTWYFKGKTQRIENKRDIQQLLSRVMTEKYHSAPKVFNELINKDRPSSQAASGRSKLMKYMLNYGDKENLSIEKFPPEKAMYMAILKELKLHRFHDGKYFFDAPYDSSYFCAWDRISKFLDSTEKQAKSFSELDYVLTSPPYGIKKGLLPIFYLHAYLVYRDDIAIYEDGKYQPLISDEHVERFIKKPESFKFQYYKLEGLNASLVDAYSQALYNGKNKSSNVIKFAQPLVKFFNDLPEFTQTTRSASLLGTSAIKLREAIKMSKSPERLIFEDLPRALDLDGFVTNEKVDARAFGDSLVQLLRELKGAYPKLLEQLGMLLSEHLFNGKEHSLSELRSVLKGQCLSIDHLAAGQVRTLINSLVDNKHEDQQWLENIFISITRKHPSKWKDQDQARAEALLADLSRRFRELQAIAHDENYKKAAQHDSNFEVIMLRSIKQRAEPREAVITINTSERESIEKQAVELYQQLSDLDSHTRMAVLAQLVELELPEGK